MWCTVSSLKYNGLQGVILSSEGLGLSAELGRGLQTKPSFRILSCIAAADDENFFFYDRKENDVREALY